MSYSLTFPFLSKKKLSHSNCCFSKYLREDDENKILKIDESVLSNITLLMMKGIVSTPKHQRCKEDNPSSTPLSLEVGVSF